MITFNTLRFKNFLSFGQQFTEISLNKNQTTVIVGRNGAGKSTMLDAITFVLYGKPYRSINKPQLVNSVNGKQCVVEIDFNIGVDSYKVVRGIKPNIFEIYENEKLIDQESHVTDYQSYLEKNILRMNYTAFTQIVVLGKATYIPFMKLKPVDRRGLIEELLGLTIFSKMNDVLKSRVTTTKGEKYSLDNLIDITEEKINLKKKYIKQLSSDNKERRRKKLEDIDNLNNDIVGVRKSIKVLEDRRNDLMNEITDHGKLTKKSKELDKIDYEFDNKIKRIKKDIKFLKDNDECPTCGQDIDGDFKNDSIKNHYTNIESVEEDKNKLNAIIQETDYQIEKINEILNQIKTIDNEISNYNLTIRQNEMIIERLNNELNDNTVIDIDKERDELDILDSALLDGNYARSDLNELLGYYQSIGTMLKDTGIKAMIVQKYLPIFNQYINQYLTKFGFFVDFQLDDTFNETIKSRYRDMFSYASFSEGEKLRLDLAILLTWREIAKMKNAMSTNLLIMDEIFDSSMDQTGVDAFIDLIPKMENANVFIISHTPGKLYDKFKSILEIEKVSNFSEIK